MSKLSLKILVHVYVAIAIILGLFAPFLTAYLAFKIINPSNVISTIFFVFLWFVFAFVLILISKYLYEEIRYRFKKIDNYLYEIENYIENQKYR
jgi:ABC-type sugar transport system permease subunit